MGWSSCKYCGETIVWARMPAGNFLPMDPDAGGLHECVPFDRGASAPAARGWTVTDRDGPVTYPTTCWWCGEPVIFHTNGYGDCVLFNRGDLGPPWDEKIHACWKAHVDEQRAALEAIDTELEKTGCNGRFYPIAQEPESGGTDGSRVSIEGYIADNHALYDEPAPARLAATGQSRSPDLAQVDVADGVGGFLRFLLPTDAAMQLQDYALIRIAGIWRAHESTSRLIATSYVTQPYRAQATGTSLRWKLRRNLKVCHYCHRSLSKRSAWGFDPGFHVECETCSRARGELSPREFLALCRRVARRDA